MKGRHSQFNYRVLRIIILFFISGTIFGQTITVVDEDSATLPGVEVFTKDLSLGLVTDLDGTVDIQNVQSNITIVFRYLGYEDANATLSDLALINYIVTLKLKEELMDEVVVLGRKTVSQSKIPFQVKTIDVKDIKATNAQTSADALAHHGGVFVQKSQLGGGSPIIRGFEANRVLLVVDDIRLNNAIYRSGHLQNAITVDQAMLDRMEIIFGPNSLMYGSDALGGVVNFKTRNPQLSNSSGEAQTAGQYYVRFASANQEKSAHVDFNYGKDKWGSLTSLTFSDYNDLRTGNKRDERFPDFGKRLLLQDRDSNGNDIAIENENPNLQVGTGYSQVDVLQKFLFTPSQEHRFAINLQYSTSSDVPRYDNVSEIRDGQLRWAEWNYGPQTRLLSALDYRHIASTSLYDQLIVIGAYQRIDEDRISRRFGNLNRERQEEDVSVYSLTIDASKYLIASSNLELEYGADIQHNDVVSTANATDINTQLSTSTLTRYASGDNLLTNIGAYIYLKRSSQDEALNLNTGLRYSSSNYKLSYDQNDPIEWPSNFYNGITGSNQALTWSVGGTYKISEPLQIRSMISTAFRSPNIDDLAKVRVNGGEITFPNINLKPERSSNVELTLSLKASKGLNISTTGFYTRLSDAIIRGAFVAPDGNSTWTTQGETLSVVGNQNIQDGVIKGLSINLSGELTQDLNWNATYNITSGREKNSGQEDQPLAHIPPTYGKIGVDYTLDRWSLKGVYRFNGSKSLEEYGGSADNPDLATPVGALSWSTFNIYGQYQISDKLELSLSAENLFDKHYRQFASGVSASGRNFVFSLKGSF